jgi:hypothetical protein
MVWRSATGRPFSRTWEHSRRRLCRSLAERETKQVVFAIETSSEIKPDVERAEAGEHKRTSVRPRSALLLSLFEKTGTMEIRSSQATSLAGQ